MNNYLKKRAGVLSPYINNFIKIKHNLGFKAEAMELSLRAFDLYSSEKGLTTTSITPEMAKDWCKQRPGEANDTWSHRTNFLRQFAIYLLNLGIEAYIPNKPQSKSDSFEPYIYSQVEVKRLLEAADRMVAYDRRHDTAINCLPLFLRMLYGTGIRFGEAIRLKMDEVNLEKNFLILKDTKNGKDRIVPFAESLSECCKQYLKYRNKLPGHCNSFFIRLNGTPCLKSSFGFFWPKLLKLAGIPHRGKIDGPRIQDWRHTFCVESMYKMSKKGKDLYYALPILSTYIGHSSLASTDRYVRMTSEMYPDLINKMDSICSYIFPSSKSI